MKATAYKKYINDNKLKQRCIACLFLGKTTIYTVKVYLFYNVRLNTDPSQVYQAILTHGGPEIIFDELKLAEASFR